MLQEAGREQIYALQAAYALAGELPPEFDVLEQNHIHLHTHSGYIYFPEEVERVYRDLFDSNQKKSRIEFTVAGANTNRVISSLYPLVTIEWQNFLALCHSKGFDLPEKWAEASKKISEKQTHKEKFRADPIYRINHPIRYRIEVGGIDVTVRCLSEPYWGLAEACYIVMGGFSPTRHYNNKERKLEYEAYNAQM